MLGPQGPLRQNGTIQLQLKLVPVQTLARTARDFFQTVECR
jgi:hypothetical protein